ncbi:glycosyltransferase family 4 protein [Afipia massiliensis]|uniref:Glycosyltransferase family 4 protein n=1 Tax=Afipia massiliensis TaxID=211460 RepID=A0A4V6Y1E6_9BRAD|nr:glycosyltransferase family 4 protein [Afipia massiliensis]TKT72403.1 glycosyltransferase family 4 protein [Afipia massiliensis]
MFNLAVDAEHVTLGFGLKWIEALSRRFTHIDIVTMTAGKFSLPKNVTVWSVGREKGYPEWLRALRFYWIAVRILMRRRIDVVFTHMIPVFAILFWPVAKLTGLKNLLWYAHGTVTPTLKVAHRLVDRVVSSTPEGFRIVSDKVTFIGQGIDSSLYLPRRRTPSTILRIVTVGRISSSKGLHILVEALQGLNSAMPWQLTIVGDATNDDERRYAAELRQQVNLGCSENIVFAGRLEPGRIAEELAAADVFVNLSATGSLDKAIVEAMASGCPVLSSNDAFCAIAREAGFSDCIVQRDGGSLTVGLEHFSKLDQGARWTIAERQSEIALREHSLEGLMDRLYANLQKCAPKGDRAS